MYKSLLRFPVRLCAYTLAVVGLVAPIHNLSAVDSDGGSSKAAKSQCENRGGYPWGWNPVTLQSCRLDQVAASNCVDTGVIGDGWGWNGTTSCRIELSDNKYRCDDSGHYPWGWNPTQNRTCRQDLADIRETASFRISYADIVDVMLACRKFQKQDAQGRNILAGDGNEFYFATLRSFNAPELGTELYTLNANYNNPNSRTVFAPTRAREAATGFLHGVNKDGSRNYGLLRIDQLDNGSFNISERDPNTRGSTTSRCVVR